MTAPTGIALRVAINTANSASARVHEDGALSGLAIELANAFAVRLGTTATFVRYGSARAILAADEKDEWDIAFIASDPARAGRYFFTRPYLAFDATCAVLNSSSRISNAELDVPDVRIAAVDGSGYTLHLRRALRRAEVAFCTDEREALALLLSGGVEAMAGARPALDQVARESPAVRVLVDRYAVLEQAIAMPWSRRTLLAALTEFQEVWPGFGLMTNNASQRVD